MFAGYNKTEPRKSVSKSPLSLRKPKQFNASDNKNNSQAISHNQTYNISCQKLNHSIINFKEESFHSQPKYGMTSYLSDIKPINNPNLDNSKFSFTTNDNLLKLSNMSNSGNI
jgi:hypothetical protein